MPSTPAATACSNGRCAMRMRGHRHTGYGSPVNDQLQLCGRGLRTHHIGARSAGAAGRRRSPKPHRPCRDRVRPNLSPVARSRRSSARSGGLLPAPAVKDATSPLPQVADGSDARPELIVQSPEDDLLDFLSREACHPVQDRGSVTYPASRASVARTGGGINSWQPPQISNGVPRHGGIGSLARVALRGFMQAPVTGARRRQCHRTARLSARRQGASCCLQ